MVNLVGRKEKFMINRLNNWRSALYDYFDAVRLVPFNEDTNNCAQFIANGWLVVRPDDPFKKYRKFKTFFGLLRAVKKDGYNNHADFYDGFMTAYEHVSQASVGDIALFQADDGDGISTVSGWVIGERVFVLRPDGLATMELSAAIKAYKV